LPPDAEGYYVDRNTFGLALGSVLDDMQIHTNKKNRVTKVRLIDPEELNDYKSTHPFVNVAKDMAGRVRVSGDAEMIKRFEHVLFMGAASGRKGKVGDDEKPLTEDPELYGKLIRDEILFDAKTPLTVYLHRDLACYINDLPKEKIAPYLQQLKEMKNMPNALDELNQVVAPICKRIRMETLNKERTEYSAEEFEERKQIHKNLGDFTDAELKNI